LLKLRNIETQRSTLSPGNDLQGVTMLSAPRILLIGERNNEIDRIRSLLDFEFSPEPDTCRTRAEASRLIRAQAYDVLIIVADPQEERGITLEPWLCELALTGPQPLLALRERQRDPATVSIFPTLLLGNLDAAQLNSAVDGAVRRRQSLRERLRGEIAHALLRGEMELRYQPVLDMHRRQLDHVEVLMRWRHPLYGLMGPEHFLEVAEASGAIHPLGIWTLRRAREQQRTWQAQGLPLIHLSINVADCQLGKPAFAQAVDACLPEDEEAGAIGLEISGATLGSCSADSRRLLMQWHARGVNLTADHIGADQGAASLQGLPLDALKFDRSLVADCEQPGQSGALKSLMELGQSLGCDTIASGVERHETARFLRAQRCDHLQGFCVSRPLSGGEMAGWMRSNLPQTQTARVAV
jgi:EAL domain-containing protein (putative c-di-GMP-specific phosphodiesterase class I)